MCVFQWSNLSIIISHHISSYCWWNKSCTSWYGKSPTNFQHFIYIRQVGPHTSPDQRIQRIQRLPKRNVSVSILCDPDVPSDKVSIRLGLNWARNLVRKPKRPLALTPKVKTCVLLRFVSGGGFWETGKNSDLGKWSNLTENLEHKSRFAASEALSVEVFV